jgi:Protein of unknown function (DUF4238)
MAQLDGQNHHYVPQFHLRAFEAQEGRRQVWRYDKTTDRIRLASIKSSASVRDLYRFDPPENAHNIELEKMFSWVETKAAPIVQKLARLSPGPHLLTDDERQLMAAYVAFLYIRGPSQLALAKAMADLHAKITTDMNLVKVEGFAERARSAGVPGSDDELEAYRVKTLADLRSGQLMVETHPKTGLASLAAGEEIAKVLLAMRWYVMRRDRAPHLVLSDTPFFVLRPPDLPEFVGAGPATPGAEIQVPLAPFAMFLARGDDSGPEVFVLPDVVGTDWPIEVGRSHSFYASRFVLGRTRNDLEAVMSGLTESQRRQVPGISVSGLPEEWREYLPPGIVAD